MIKELHIKNFKSHQDTNLILKPISIFIGPNNSGKSSIIQSLQLLKQTIKTGNNQFVVPKPNARTTQRGPNVPVQYSYPNLSVDMGQYNDVIGKNGNIISVHIKGSVQSISAAMLKRGIENIEVDYRVNIKDNILFSCEGTIQAGQQKFEWTYAHGKGGEVRPSSLLIDGIQTAFRVQQSIHSPFNAQVSSVPPNTPVELQSEVNDFCQSVSQSVQRLFNSVFSISGIRGFEEHAYHLAETPSTNEEYILLEDRSIAISSSLPYNRTLEDRLSSWLEKFLGVGIQFEFTQGKLVIIRAKKANKSSLFIGEGLGIQQLVFLFFPIALGQIKTICIEEPEVHLHPKAQTQLVSHLLDIYKEEKKQYIIPTHSEHILFAFLNAVAKKQITTEELGIYYFHKQDDSAEVTPLDIDEHGRVVGGLPGFFEHSVSNLIEYLGALK